MSQWVLGKQLVRLLVVFAAVPALAEPPVLNPNTGLALEPRVKSAETCVVLPDALYDPEACSGIPRGDSKTLPEKNKSLHALAVMRWGETHVMLTVSSVTRPGIGQMSGAQIAGFREAMLTRLADDFKIQPRAVETGGKPYTLVRIQGVPVVRWEYTTDVPDTDPQANVASGVVFLVPSRDTLDLVSFNCHQKDLATARELGDQVMSTLKVPVTIDVEGFGGRSWTDPGVVAFLTGGLVLLLLAGGFLWWRRQKAG
jgi:hypothetical protein